MKILYKAKRNKTLQKAKKLYERYINRTFLKLYKEHSGSLNNFMENQKE